MPPLKEKPPLHDTLTGKDYRSDPPPGRAKAIRLKCIECMGGSYKAVRECHIYDCALWPYRSGHVSRKKSRQKAVVPSETRRQTAHHPLTPSKSEIGSKRTIFDLSTVRTFGTRILESKMNEQATAIKT